MVYDTSKFEAKFRAAMDRSLSRSGYAVAEAVQDKPAGYFSISTQAREGRSDLIRMTIAPFGEARIVKFNIATDGQDAAQTAAFVEKVKEILRASHFHFDQDPTTKDVLSQELEVHLQKLVKAEPEYQNSAGNYQGLFSFSQIWSSPARDISHRILLELRPIGHVEKHKKSYLPDPHRITLSLGTKDIPQANQFAADIESYLKSKGFHKQRLSSNKDTSKPIPKHWVNMADLSIHRNPEQYWTIQVVKSAIGKKCRISFSTGVTDQAKAERMLGCLKEYLPAVIQDPDQELTIDGMRQYLEKEFPPEPNKNNPAEATIEQRIVYGIDGQEKCRLFTPVMVCKNGDYSVGIKIAPARCGAFSARTLLFPLNTPDREDAQYRRITVQNFAHALLTHYFSEHPQANFALDTIEKRKRGRTEALQAIKSQPGWDYPLNVITKELEDIAEKGFDEGKKISELSQTIYAAFREESVAFPPRNLLTGEIKQAFQIAAGDLAFDKQNATPSLRVLVSAIDHFKKRRRDLIWNANGARINTQSTIDLRTLRENILLPSLDYAREILWRIDITPETDNLSGQQRVTLTAVRDLNIPYGEDMEPWNKPVVLHALSRAVADQFAGIVTTSLIAAQQTMENGQEILISRERPVRQFGDNSARFVLKESLKKGLALEGIEIENAPDNRSLSHLQKEARHEKSKAG